MSPLWPATAFVVSAAVAVWASVSGLREPALTRPNHRGRPVAVVLGRALVGAVKAGALVALGLAALAGPVPRWPIPLLLVASVWVLAAVGAADDRRESGPRGLAAHVASLLRGRPTTGIVKLVTGVAAAVLLGWRLWDRPVDVVASVLVIALSVNVTNALDVRPGRALKWALLVLIPVTMVAWGSGIVLATASTVGAAMAVLAFDLRERAMLGDAGSNPLGLVVGTGLAAVLPTPWLVAAALVLAALQIAAETVTISRLIDAAPPLRGLDRLGRPS